LELGELVFKEINPEKNLGARRESTTNSTQMWQRARIKPCHIGGRKALSNNQKEITI